MIRVTDKIMMDFCHQLGGVEAGMLIVRRQLGLAGLDGRAPTDKAIRETRDRRLAWLGGAE